MVAVNDPHQIRAQVDAVLADLPDFNLRDLQDPQDPEAPPQPAVDIDAVATRLEEAHQILVDALESVEKG